MVPVLGHGTIDLKIALRLGLTPVEAFHSRPAPKALGETVALSGREKEVLEMLAEGFLVKEIADKLGVGFGTVRTYVRRVYEKLHVRSRAQAVAKYTHFAERSERH